MDMNESSWVDDPFMSSSTIRIDPSSLWGVHRFVQMG